MRRMKREKKLTKRERKALKPGPKPPAGHDHQHIHCISCGRHIDAPEFSAPIPKAQYITCDHGSRFPSCTSCMAGSQALIDEHERTGQQVNAAPAFH